MCVNLHNCVTSGTLGNNRRWRLLEQKNKRIQITLREDIIADLDAVSKKYDLSKSNIISMLSQKYLKEEFGDYKNN